MKTKKTLIIVLSLLFIANQNLFAAKKISPERQNVINYALKLQGIPYVWGGNSLEGFDCSAFVGYVYLNSVNIDLPRTSKEMYKKVKLIDPKEKEPGDLIFFCDDKGTINHVGIYCGVYRNKKNPKTRFEGKRIFISAISDGPRTGVQVELVDATYWKKHFVGYGRLLQSTADYNAEKYGTK